MLARAQIRRKGSFPNGASSCAGWILLAGALLWCAACQPTSPERTGRMAPPASPNIVLVTFDTLNLWRTSLFNETLDTTPNLERLAERAFFVRRAHTRVPLTLPSHVSMMSGRFAIDLGVFANGDFLPPGTPTLASLLQQRGYTTAAFVSLGVLNPRFGLGEGFEHYRESYRGRPGVWYAAADEVLTDVASWLADRAPNAPPFFLWVHLSDPHEPYGRPDMPADVELTIEDRDGAVREVGQFRLAQRESHQLTIDLPPGRSTLRFASLRAAGPDDLSRTSLVIRIERAAGARAIVERKLPTGSDIALAGTPLELEFDNTGTEPAPLELDITGSFRAPPRAWLLENYDRDVRFADRGLGDLSRLLEPWHETTLWAVASDHGEGLNRQGVVGHAAWVGEDQLRILFLLAAPWLEARIVDDVRGTTADLAPTVLEAAGLPVPETMSGRSLVLCSRTADCRTDDEWLAYGVRRNAQLNAIALYRWPDKLSHTFKRRRRYVDLERDPRESRNRIRGGVEPENDPRLEAMSEALEEEATALGQRLDRAASEREIDQETEDALRALGYLED